MAPSRAAWREAAARRFCAAAAEALGRSGRFAVALAGGRTPREVYARLAEPPCAARVDWGRTQVFWSDERCVPPDHAASNYGMAREALLSRVPLPGANVHRIRGEDEPERAASACEADLARVLGGGERPPRLDLVLLGLGADGHAASLFPGGEALGERRRWARAVPPPRAGGAWRVTLTPVLIAEAAEVIFLVAGREKAVVVARVLEGPRDPEALPAQGLAPREGVLRWLLDAPAAAGLAAAARRPS